MSALPTSAAFVPTAGNGMVFDASALQLQAMQLQQLQAQQLQAQQLQAQQLLVNANLRGVQQMQYVTPEVQLAQIVQGVQQAEQQQQQQDQLDTLLAYNTMLAQAQLKAAPQPPVQRLQTQMQLQLQQQLHQQPAAGRPLFPKPAQPTAKIQAEEIQVGVRSRLRVNLTVGVGGPASEPSTPSPTNSSTGLTSPTAQASRKPQKALDVVVCTPWYPEGVNKHDVRLCEEVLCFSDFVRLTEREELARSEAVAALQAAAPRWFSAARITPYGSFVTRTMTSASAVDVCIDACGRNAITDSSVHHVASAAGCTVRGAVTLMDDPEGGKNAFVQLQHDITGALLNVTLHQTPYEMATKANAVVRTWGERFPSVVAAHAVLRQVLHQTGNLDVCKGGLSSYALLAMLVALCVELGDRIPQVKTTPGVLLVHACRVFGTTCSFDTTVVCTQKGFIAKPQGAADGEKVFVRDPLNAENNLAANCSRLFAIRAQLAHCSKALQRWEVDMPADEVLAGGAKKGYKGRTPLSGIISHQKLWSRATEREEAEDDAHMPCLEEEEEIESDTHTPASSPTNNEGDEVTNDSSSQSTQYDALCPMSGDGPLVYSLADLRI